MEATNFMGQVISRTLVKVLDLKWYDAEHTILVCNVVFKEIQMFGPLPFSTTDNADTPWGQDIWDRAIAGEFGVINEPS